MDNPSTCPICKGGDVYIGKPTPDLVYLIKCKRCGEFRISVTYFHSDLSEFGESHVLSGAIRNLFEKGEKINLLYEEDFKGISDFAKTNEPKDPFEKIDLLIKYIYNKMNKMENMGTGVAINESCDFPIIYAKDYSEFLYIMKKTEELGYIEFDVISQGHRLALGGWEKLKELLQKEVKSHQAFVAMWFDSSLEKAWEDGFKAALEETGYKPLRIDLKEHNEKICDVIIAEIQDSGLLVADFTGQRGGVYFEAGFAKGLGIPVIWTCRKDDEEKLHFDTRQYNHIIWEKPEDLKKQLINRIKATLPNR